MRKTVGLGQQDFKQLIEEKVFYIDKTKFISEWWDSKDSVTLITRPRRFGKTLMLSTVEKFFSAGKDAPENFYHGLVIGLLVELRGRYEIKSNRESGLGRYDVMLRPMDKNDNAIIIEFKSKRRSDKSRTLDELADMALMQIEEKKYETELLEAGYSADKINKFAFVFEGKELLIKGAGKTE